MEERLKVLQMVQQGKVTPEEAFELITALQHGQGRASAVESLIDFHQQEQPARRLRVSATSSKGSKFNFDIPLGLIKFFYSWLPNCFNITVNQQQVNTQHLMERVYAGKKGVVYREGPDNSAVIIELV